MQATDRLAMIQMLGRLMQQVITTITLSISIIYFSPWLLLLLIAGVLPAFVGESHFAFLGYAKNFRQTPVRRQLDYLRVLGGSKEAAKELKLFGLSNFLTDRFTRLSDEIYEENVALSRAQADRGRGAVDRRLAGLLLGLCLRHLADGDRRAHHRLAVLPGGSDSAGQQQHSADLLDAVRGCRSGAVPHRSAGVLRDAADDPLQAECACRRRGRSCAASSSATFRSAYPGSRAAHPEEPGLHPAAPASGWR